MRVYVPRLGSKVAVDVDGGVATFCTGERRWQWKRTVDGVECVSDVVATAQQRGQAKGIAERAFKLADELESTAKA